MSSSSGSSGSGFHSLNTAAVGGALLLGSILWCGRQQWYKKHHGNNEEDNEQMKRKKNNELHQVNNESWLRSPTDLPKFDLLHQGHAKGGKLLIVMVGLPGRGKTYIARKIARYLRWISYRTRAFSVAKYRLDTVGSKTADYYDPAAASYRERVSLVTTVLEDALRYLNRGGEIAIIDGTNTSSDRRQLIRDRVAQENGYEILWIESIYSTSVLTEEQLESLRQSPDFVSEEDFHKRVKMYEQTYAPLADHEGSFVKVFDNGKQLLLHEIFGFLRTKIVSFVMNLHTSPRTVYIVRHGESDYNTRQLIGGDSGLTELGLEFSRALASFLHLEELKPEERDRLCVWTSPLLRCRETAVEIPCKKLVEWRALREIEVGICDGLSYETIKQRFPEEFRARQLDKLKYRYPRGESYQDVITRLEPIIFELERQREPLVIIGHQAVLRCLYAYFLDLPAEEIPFLSIPLNTLIRLEVNAYGCREKRMRIHTEGEEENGNDILHY